MSRADVSERIRNNRDVKIAQPDRINEKCRKKKIIHFNKVIPDTWDAWGIPCNFKKGWNLD